MRKLTQSIPRRIAAIALALGAFSMPCAAADDEPPPFSPPGSFFNAHFGATDGPTLYRTICQACHMADARGAQGAGTYPALAANVRLASADYPVGTVLNGRHNMPALGGMLSDDQVAAVVNFVRSHFDNHYTDTVAPADVARLRPHPPTGAAP